MGLSLLPDCIIVNYNLIFKNVKMNMHFHFYAIISQFWQFFFFSWQIAVIFHGDTRINCLLLICARATVSNENFNLSLKSSTRSSMEPNNLIVNVTLHNNSVWIVIWCRNAVVVCRAVSVTVYNWQSDILTYFTQELASCMEVRKLSGF